MKYRKGVFDDLFEFITGGDLAFVLESAKNDIIEIKKKKEIEK